MDGRADILGAVAASGYTRRRHRPWPWVVGGVLGALVVAGVAWLTVVGYDVTVVDGSLHTEQSCRIEVVAEGVPLSDYSGDWHTGIETRWLPPGDRVRIHRQLFHRTTYTFLADDGSKVSVRPAAGIVPSCQA